MAPVKCEQCDKEFKSEQALKIHVGRLHRSKPKAKAGRKRGRKGGQAGKTTCAICGRSFRLPLHLGRHMAATHGKAKKARKGKRGRRAVARRVVARRVVTRPRGVPSADVSSLTVDQLLGIKSAVDARLADIARRMRQARVKA